MKLFGRNALNGPPLIISEISGSHGGSLDQACKLIDLAHAAGADAVKIQTYTPESLTIKCDRRDFIVDMPLWKGQTLWDLYQEAQTPPDWLPVLFKCAERVGIPIFSSVFDLEGLIALEAVECTAYKVASFELTDVPLIQSIGQTGKPMILSTGMANDEEINDALSAIPSSVPVGLLHCCSGYPSPPEDMNLPRMADLKRRFFPRVSFVGLSDHTTNATAAIAATALGARMIEKHLCLEDGGGPDAEFSLRPPEFSDFVESTHDAWAACQPFPGPSQEASRPYRRSLYVVEDMRANDPFSPDNVRSIRPGYGLPPKMLRQVLQHKAAVDIAYGTPLSLDLLA